MASGEKELSELLNYSTIWGPCEAVAALLMAGSRRSEVPHTSLHPLFPRRKHKAHALATNQFAQATSPSVESAKAPCGCVGVKRVRTLDLGPLLTFVTLSLCHPWSGPAFTSLQVPVQLSNWRILSSRSTPFHIPPELQATSTSELPTPSQIKYSIC
jgi:hypothetical protein